MNGPPRLAEWLLRKSLTEDYREPLLGDLAEEYVLHVRPRRGSIRARLWYWNQALRSSGAATVERIRSHRRDVPANHTQGKGNPMRSLAQDLRFGIRNLFRNPGFTLIVVITLALGIGANTVVFSVIDSLVLNPFDFPEGDRLVGVGPVFPKRNQGLGFVEVLSPPEFADIKAQSQTLEKVVCWDMGNRQVSGSEAPENVFAGFWWGDAFGTLGVQPALGRGFLEEEISNGSPVAIVSHRFWQRRFGADPNKVGEKILVNGNPHTLVGVMPPGTLIYGTDLWLPMGVGPERFPRNRRQMQILGRLRPGTSLEEARVEMNAIAGRLESEYGKEFGEYENWNLVPETWTRINTQLLRPAGAVLMAAVAFVLLLVCANMTSYFLARALKRNQEIAIRTAMGASRPRILSQLLTEGVLISVTGGALGLGLAYLGVQAGAGALADIPFAPGSVSVNPRVLAFTAIVSVAVGLLLGLIPALRVTRPDLHQTLKSESGSATQSARKLRLQTGLVGVEVALAVVLLMGGGLVLRSFVHLQSVDPGFEVENALTMRLTLPWEKYEGERINSFFYTLIERIEGIPGVTMAAASSQVPPRVFGRRQFWIDGHVQEAEGRLPAAYATLVTEGYFETMGMRLLSGRLFDEKDRGDFPSVAVINQETADRYFPGQDPLGKRFKIGGPDADSPFIEVVGVVASTSNRGVRNPPQPEIFASLGQAQGWNNQLYLVIRTGVPPRTLLDAVRAEVAALDANQPLYAVQTLEESLATSISQWKIATRALTVFASFALVLAAVGIFSIVSYKTAARRQEIGLRIALGARISEVSRQVTLQALVPVLVGSLAGLALSIGLARFMENFLFEVSGTDPVTMAAVMAVLLAAAFLASYLPAYRASRMDPVSALRYE